LTTPQQRQIDAVLELFDGFMDRMVASHAPEMTDVAVTMAQAKVLYVVAAAGSLRMSELAMRLGVTLSTASGAVDRLVDLGLLERRADATDRRQVIVALTETGAETLERMRELNQHQMRLLLERLSDEELAVIERAISILAAAALPGAPIAVAAGATDQSEGNPQ
jgi:DNA-binding MarR family transcriptional regulator